MADDASTHEHERARPPAGGPDYVAGPNEPTESARAVVGAMWSSLSYAAPFAFTLVSSIVAARILGPTAMGRLSFIAFAALTVQNVLSSSLSYSIIRETAEQDGRGRSEAVRGLVSFGWGTFAALGGLGALLLAAVAATGSEPTWAWIFAAVAVLAGCASRAPASVLQGIRLWKLTSIATVSSNALALVATIAALAAGWGVSGIMGATALSNVALVVLATVFVRRALGGPWRVPCPPDVRRETVRFALASTPPVILSFVVLQRIEVFFLERSSTESEIAQFSIAFAAVMALAAIPTAVRVVTLPSVATLVGAGELDRVRSGYSRLVRMLLLGTIPVVGALVVLSPALIGVVYGHEYERAGDTLVIMVLGLPSAALMSSAGALVMAFGRARVPTIAYLVGGLADVVLAAALVPRFGALGAAVANVAGVTAVSAVLVPYSVKLAGGLDIDKRPLARLVALTGVAAGAAAVPMIGGTSAWRLAVGAAAFTAVFVGLGRVLRPLGRDDGAWLARDIAPRLGGWVGGLARWLSGAPLEGG